MLCLVYYYLSVCLFIFSHGVVSLFSIYEFDCLSGIFRPSFLTGKCRGAAHKKCNLDFHFSTFVPIVFHNLTGYDANLFVKELGFTDGKIHCIPKTDEKRGFRHAIH